MLDYAQEATASLRGRLSVDDQRVLDQYQTGVRDVERRLEGGGLATCLDTASASPPASGLDTRAHVQAMHELMVLAFQCDRTRVITYMIGNGQSDRSFDFLGFPDGHHTYTHQGSDVPVRAIARWEVDRCRDLIERLLAVPTPSGTLLDETFLLFGSEMGHGADHQPTELPLLLAGRGGGRFTPGDHLVFPDATPLANLHLALLQAAGVEVDTFGDDSSGSLLDLA